MTDIDTKEVSNNFIELFDIGYKFFSHSARPKLSGIHGAQYRLLAILYNIPEETMTNLGKTMSISKQNMTNLVDSLIKEEFVERLPDPQDRRVIYVKITEAGRKNLREIRKEMRANIQSQIENLEPSDLELLSVSIQNLLTIRNKYL